MGYVGGIGRPAAPSADTQQIWGSFNGTFEIAAAFRYMESRVGAGVSGLEDNSDLWHQLRLEHVIRPFRLRNLNVRLRDANWGVVGERLRFALWDTWHGEELLGVEIESHTAATTRLDAGPSGVYGPPTEDVEDIAFVVEDPDATLAANRALQGSWSAEIVWV